jgi:putative endonuclease
VKPPGENRHQKGIEGESLAAEFLRNKGCRLVERNFRCAVGEIDLIVRDGKTLVFVEVKSRRGLRYGLPQEAVSTAKQRRLTRLAQWYLQDRRLEKHPARFDVVAVTWSDGKPELTWIVNAFEALE